MSSSATGWSPPWLRWQRAPRSTHTIAREISHLDAPPRPVTAAAMQTLLSARLPRTSAACGAPRAAAQRRAAASACPLSAPHAAAAAQLAPRFRRAPRHAAARASSAAVAQFKTILSAEIPVHLPRCAARAAPAPPARLCAPAARQPVPPAALALAARHARAPPRLALAAGGCYRGGAARSSGSATQP